MATKTVEKEPSEFAQMIIEGITRSSRKMVEKAAANNESLIVGDGDGFKEVSAKEILKTLPQK